MPLIDATDRQIIELLRQDGRMSVAEISRAVSLSPAPVARRIERLEQTGVIRGYTALIDDHLSGSVEAFTEIRLMGNVETTEVAKILRDLPEIISFYTIAGDPDALVRIRVEDVDHLQRVVNTMRRTGKLTASKTLIVMHSWNRDATR